MSSFVERVIAAEETIRKAKADYRDAANEAERALRRVESEYHAAIQTIEQDIAVVEDDFLRSRGSYENITLYVDHFNLNRRSVILSNETKAYIETRGQIKARVVGSQSETRDDRELLLIIETPEERIVINGDPDDARKAQGFVKLFVEIASNAEIAQKEKEQRITELTKALEEGKANNNPIEEAKKQLREAEANNGFISEAEVELTRLIEGASQYELAELALYHKERRRKDKQKWVILGIVMVVLIMIVVLLFTLP